LKKLPTLVSQFTARATCSWRLHVTHAICPPIRRCPPHEPPVCSLHSVELDSGTAALHNALLFFNILSANTKVHCLFSYASLSSFSKLSSTSEENCPVRLSLFKLLSSHGTLIFSHKHQHKSNFSISEQGESRSRSWASESRRRRLPPCAQEAQANWRV
jgi:hypothetical protein